MNLKPLLSSYNKQSFSPFFAGCFFLPLCLCPFLPGYDPSKWLLLYIFSSLSLLLINSGAFFAVPKLSQMQKYLLIGLGLVFVFNTFYHDTHLGGKEILDRLMFWTLFFFYCSCFKGFEFSAKQHFFYALFLGTAFFVVGGFLNFIFIKPQLSFTFGNLNKAAEFVGFSLALQLGLLSSYSQKIQRWLLVLISFSLAYIYFTKCRSAWIGTTFVFVYLIGIKKISWKTFLHIFLGAVALSIFFEVIFLAGEGVPVGLSVKEGSITERWHILLNTLSLIFDHPLGVGLGRFSFAATPYMKNLPHNVFNDTYYLFSPYNEPLRFFAEEGIIASFLMLLFFMSFIFPFQKLKILSARCPESVAFLIFFLIQGTFQYPLSEPAVLFLIPFVLAYSAHYTMEIQSVKILGFTWIMKGLGGYFSFVAVLMGSSIYLSTLFSSDLVLSKNIYYLWKDQNLLTTILFMSYADKNYKETKKLALNELDKEPQHWLALKYLGLANIKSGNKDKGCSQLKMYGEVYATLSSDVEKVLKDCQ